MGSVILLIPSFQVVYTHQRRHCKNHSHFVFRVSDSSCRPFAPSGDRPPLPTSPSTLRSTFRCSYSQWRRLGWRFGTIEAREFFGASRVMASCISCKPPIQWTALNITWAYSFALAGLFSLPTRCGCSWLFLQQCVVLALWSSITLNCRWIARTQIHQCPVSQVPISHVPLTTSTIPSQPCHHVRNAFSALYKTPLWSSIIHPSFDITMINRLTMNLRTPEEDVITRPRPIPATSSVTQSYLVPADHYLDSIPGSYELRSVRV